METYQQNPDGTISIIGVVDTVTMDSIDKQIADLTNEQKLYFGDRNTAINNAAKLQTQIDALTLRKTNIVKQFPQVAPTS